MNLRAPFLLSKAAFPHMREAGGGTIVNISSVAGKKGWANASAYCSPKFGLTGLTEALADEGKAHGIRAVLLYPGAMATNWGAFSPEERRAGAGRRLYRVVRRLAAGVRADGGDHRPHGGRITVGAPANGPYLLVFS